MLGHIYGIASKSSLYTCTHTHAQTHTHMHIHTHTHTCTYTHIHAHAHTYTHIHTHAYTHICTHCTMKQKPVAAVLAIHSVVSYCKYIHTYIPVDHLFSYDCHSTVEIPHTSSCMLTILI